MKPRLLFITGNDTGIGKTVLAALLVRHLREQGARVAGLKPICSGGREDAHALHQAAGKVLSLDIVNPWHFRAALAPVLAARREKRQVELHEVVKHVTMVAREFEWLVIEGAGGLLSPLGEGFDSRDLIQALRAQPIIVCPNRLGAVNQVRLVWEALPAWAKPAPAVLISQPRPDSASRTNPELLAEFIKAKNIHLLPRVKPDPAALPRSLRMTLEELIKSCR